MFTSQIRFGGLFSGMDTNSMVQQMMRAESMRLNRFTQRRQLVEWRQDHFRTASDWLRDFQVQQLSIANASRLGNLSSSDLINSSFNTMRSTVTGPSGVNSSALTVRAGMTATPGRFEVKVDNPATPVTIRGTTVSDGTLTGAMLTTPADWSWTGVDFNFNLNLNGNNVTITLRDGVNGVDLRNASTIGATVEDEINRQLRERFSPQLNTNPLPPDVLDNQRVVVKFNTITNQFVFSSNYDKDTSNNIRDVITLTAGTTTRTEAGSLIRSCALSMLGFASGDNNTFQLNRNLVSALSEFSAPNPGFAPITFDRVLPFPMQLWTDYTDAGGWRYHSFSTRPEPATFAVNPYSNPPLIRNVMTFVDTNNNNRVVEVVNMNLSTDPASPPQWREVERDGSGVATRVVPSNPIVVTGPLRVVNNFIHEPRLHQSMTVNGVSISVFPEDSVGDVINRTNGSRAGVNITFDSHNRRFTMTTATTGVGSRMDINDPTNFLFGLGLGTYTPKTLDTNVSARTAGWLDPGPNGWPTPVAVLRSGDDPNAAPPIVPPASWGSFNNGMWSYASRTTTTQVRARFTYIEGTNPPRELDIWSFERTNGDFVEFVQLRTGTNLTYQDFLVVTRDINGSAIIAPPAEQLQSTDELYVLGTPAPLRAPVFNYNHIPVFEGIMEVNGQNVEVFSDDTIQRIIDRINDSANGFNFEIETTSIYKQPFLVSTIGVPVSLDNDLAKFFFAKMHNNEQARAREAGLINAGRPGGWPETVTRSTDATPASWAAFAGSPTHENPAGWELFSHTSVPVQAFFTHSGFDRPVMFYEVGSNRIEFIQIYGTNGSSHEHFILVQRDVNGNVSLAGNSPPNHPTAAELPAIQAAVAITGAPMGSNSLVYNWVHTPDFRSSIEINGQSIEIRHNDTVDDIINRINTTAGLGTGVGIIRDEDHGIPVLVGNPTIIDPTGFIQHLNNKLTQAIAHKNTIDEANNKAADQVTFGKNARITIDTGEHVLDASGNPIFDSALNRFETILITLDSETNYFTYQGHTITINGAQADQIFTVDTTRDVSDAMDNIRAFVDSYNALILSINTMHTTARPRTNNRAFFEPLTQEERAAMSDREIERWEDLAKTGLLHRDRTLRDIQNQLRQWITSGVTLQPGGETVFLHQLGITTGGGPQELRLIGMLQIDEARLQAALEQNPERAMRLFTQAPPPGVAANTSERNARLPHQGLNGRLNDIIANAISSTGTLFELAGTANTNSVTTRQMAEYDRRINDMHSWLARRETSLFAMFSRMEVAMARSQQQMESLWMFGNQ